MSSREVLELASSGRDNVKRAIETLAESDVFEFPHVVEIRTAIKTGTEYRISKRDRYVIVAQLSPACTAKLVERWKGLSLSWADFSAQYIRAD